jgi:flagellar biosynthetic protein FliQ
MDPVFVVEIGRKALLIVLQVSGPLLLSALVVGLMVGVFQAVTQIHEMTLTFIPKILTIVGMLFIVLPWMLMTLTDFTVRLFNMIPGLVE